MKRLLFSWGVILLAAGAPPAGADIVLYEQPANAGHLGHYSNEGLMEMADDFTPSAVTGGVPMWLSLVESDGGTPGSRDTQWLWNYSDYPSGAGKAARYAAGSWVRSSGDMAFTRRGDAVMVPAPGTILLSALGVALVGWLRLRRTL